MVEGRSSSVRSQSGIYQQCRELPKDDTIHTFLHSDLGGAGFWLLLCRGLLVLLHAPYLIYYISFLEDLNLGLAELTLIMVGGRNKVESLRGSQSRVWSK